MYCLAQVRTVRHILPGVRLPALVPQGEHLLEGGKQLVLDVAAWVRVGRWVRRVGWLLIMSHVG